MSMNRQLVFLSDVSIVGHAISTPEKDIPTLPDDVTIKRGMFGHYLSRKIDYKQGEAVRPQSWHRSGDNVNFHTGVFNFVVPIESIALRNVETGKTTPIKRKFERVELEEVEVKEVEAINEKAE